MSLLNAVLVHVVCVHIFYIYIILLHVQHTLATYDIHVYAILYVQCTSTCICMYFYALPFVPSILCDMLHVTA